MSPPAFVQPAAAAAPSRVPAVHSDPGAPTIVGASNGSPGSLKNADGSPRMVRGRRVVRVEMLATPFHTPEKPSYTDTILVLVLDNATTVMGCGECLFVGTRGRVRVHRAEAHPTKARQKRNAEKAAELAAAAAGVQTPAKVAPEKVAPPVQLPAPQPRAAQEVLLPRAAVEPAKRVNGHAPKLGALTDAVAGMTLAEILEAASHYQNYSVLLEQKDQDLARAVEKVRELEMWKRKMVRRFKDMGFELKEED